MKRRVVSNPTRESRVSCGRKRRDFERSEWTVDTEKRDVTLSELTSRKSYQFLLHLATHNIQNTHKGPPKLQIQSLPYL